MVVLRAIGNFFVKIGRWIKNTAWVQPLLIVGALFGVIFSISPIVKGIQKAASSTGDAAASYYKKSQLSWSGVKNEDGDYGKSQVDELFKYIDNQSEHEAANDALYKKFGKKFFVNFVKSDCDYCTNNYYGFKYLQSNWGKGEFAFKDEEGNTINKNQDGYETFKIFNIFVDKTDTDSDGQEYYYFTKYVLGDDSSARYTTDFEVFSTLQTNYTVNNTISVAEKIYPEDENSFTPPAVLLFDFDFEPASGDYYDLSVAGDLGLTEIFFNNAGDSTIDKAKFAWECWNHDGAFSKTGERD